MANWSQNCPSPLHSHIFPSSPHYLLPLPLSSLPASSSPLFITCFLSLLSSLPASSPHYLLPLPITCFSSLPASSPLFYISIPLFSPPPTLSLSLSESAKLVDEEETKHVGSHTPKNTQWTSKADTDPRGEGEGRWHGDEEGRSREDSSRQDIDSPRKGDSKDTPTKEKEDRGQS